MDTCPMVQSTCIAMYEERKAERKEETDRGGGGVRRRGRRRRFRVARVGNRGPGARLPAPVAGNKRTRSTLAAGLPKPRGSG